MGGVEKNWNLEPNFKYQIYARLWYQNLVPNFWYHYGRFWYQNLVPEPGYRYEILVPESWYENLVARFWQLARPVAI